MMPIRLELLAEVFSHVPDPRKRRGIRHPLPGMLALVFLGLNGHTFEASDEEVIAQMVALAAGRVTERKCATWLRNGLRREPPGAA